MNINDTLKEHFDEIIDAVSDDLLISDGHGTVLRVSPSFEEVYGINNEDALGKTVFELEKEGYFKPSIIAEVLRQKVKLTMAQKTKTGRDIVVTATPVYDKEGEIRFVVSFSRDITEVVTLQKRYSRLEHKIERYKGEISKLRRDSSTSDFVSNSASMEKIMSIVSQVADYDINVLLLGDSGVGKTSLARKIHKMSERAGNAFVDINCAAIPENLLEAELFGYEKGSFTGADSKGKIGLIEMAHKGTLFLDEISELPLRLQAKTLKAIQDKVITRVGGINAIKVDFRLIAASNRDLDEYVNQGLFRKDLYYRLNAIKIRIPSLAERRDDIIPLINYFLDHFNEKYGRDKSISPQAMELLCAYDWPGNVREISNVIERVYITSSNGMILDRELPEELTRQKDSEQAPFEFRGGLNEAICQLEKQMVTEAFEKYGTTTGVARCLNISQPTASRKVMKYIKNKKEDV
ncbi:sigma 54-interacting transcriptional regulator [bacterium 210820-DFI.6.37]|nr:sigma 54-interacting transcriptional regulator [bacterium 210820-DFI.6.37]